MFYDALAIAITS